MRPVGLLWAGLLLVGATALVAPEQDVGASRAIAEDASVAARYRQGIELEQGALVKTQGLLAEKLTTREGEMKGRVRALYKLSRANWPRLWFEPQARRESARWLGAARRVAMRDVREIEMLHDEIALANRAERRLEREVLQVPAPAPRAGSLQWPVDDSKILQEFGDYKGPSHRVVLRSRGVRLSCAPNQSVSPVAKGQVRYLGPLRGLGTSLIIDHGEYTSILGGLAEPSVAVGETVRRDTVLAMAEGKSLYLELRLAAGPLGHSIDPQPLLVAPL